MWKTLLELLFDYAPNEPVLQSCFVRLEWSDYGCPTYDVYLFEYGDHRWVSIQGQVPESYSGTSRDMDIKLHNAWCRVAQWLQAGDYNLLARTTKVGKWARVKTPKLPGVCVYRVYGNVPECFKKEVLDPNPTEASVKYNDRPVCFQAVHGEEHF